MSTIYRFSLLLAALLLINPAPFSSSSAEAKAWEQIASSSKIMKESCGHAEIQVSQGPESSSVGIPRFRVMIANLCSDCWIAQLHLHCGEFASANVVDPELFKRITDGDCLVNGGRRIHSGKVIEFHYSNTFPYSLSVGDYVCGHY